jgi:prepilin-type N-terminal cleavage/methylation domain-containing protein
MDCSPIGSLRTTSRTACARRPRALSLVELIVVISIISLLSVLLLTVMSQVRTASQSTRCMANLRNISVAFSMYANDNDGRFPTPVAVSHSWESLLDRYISQKATFACPADTEMFPAVGSSYDWRDTPDPLTTLAGRPISNVTRPDAVLAFETLPGWHARHFMNAVRVNGSAATLSDDQCLLDLQVAVSSTPVPVNVGVTGP